MRMLWLWMVMCAGMVWNAFAPSGGIGLVEAATEPAPIASGVVFAADSSEASRPRAAAGAVSTPDTAEVRRLGVALAGAPAARVSLGARTYVVLRPRVETSGLAFEKVEGIPRPRPAVVVYGEWDTVPPPPNPIPWSVVNAVDKRVMTRRPTTIFGAVIGGLFFAGTAYGFGKWAEGEGGSPTEAPVVIGVGLAGAVVFGLLGSLIQTPEWVSEYPPPH
ncbi:MAG: hypothetical protein ACHQ52_11335 [Candidatus Eisenbacteria bacterium]